MKWETNIVTLIHFFDSRYKWNNRLNVLSLVLHEKLDRNIFSEFHCQEEFRHEWRPKFLEANGKKWKSSIQSRLDELIYVQESVDNFVKRLKDHRCHRHCSVFLNVRELCSRIDRRANWIKFENIVFHWDKSNFFLLDQSEKNRFSKCRNFVILNFGQFVQRW